MQIKKLFAAMSIGSALSMTAGLANATTLRQVVIHTMYTNPDILLDTNIRQASLASVRASEGRFLPTVDVNVGYGRQESENVTTNFADISLNRNEAGIFVNQMIFDGFATPSDVARNKSKTIADAYRVWGTADNTALLAIEAYLEILQDQAIVAINRNHVSVINRSFGEVKDRSESGVGRRADMDQASSRLSLAQSNLLAAQNNLRDAITTFKKITGMVPRNLVSPAVPGSNAIPRTDSALVKRTVDENPFVRSATADVAEAVHQYEFTQSPFMPRLDLQAGVNKNRNIDGAPGPNHDSFVMLRASYNIFRGGSDIAAHREAAYQVEQAKDIKDRTLREAVERARLAWADYQTALVRVPVLNNYRNSAGATVGAYVDQFQLGKRTLLDLLDSEDEAFTARVSYVQEVYQLKVAKFRILNSMGVLLPYMNIPLPEEAAIPFKEHYLKPKLLYSVGGRMPQVVVAPAPAPKATGDMKSPNYKAPKSHVVAQLDAPADEHAIMAAKSNAATAQAQQAQLKPNYTVQPAPASAQTQQAALKPNYMVRPASKDSQQS